MPTLLPTKAITAIDPISPSSSKFPLDVPVMGYYLFFDTETTGLPDKGEYNNPEHPNTPHIVSLAALLYDEVGNLIDKLYRIVRPDGYAIPDEVVKIHGITTERALAEGVPLWMAMWELDRLVTRAKCMVAHNNQFDRLIVKGAHHRLGVPYRFRELDKHCTMMSSIKLCSIPKEGGKGIKWPKLEELYFFLFGEKMAGAHNALVDTEACAKCFFEIKRRNNLPTEPASDK